MKRIVSPNNVPDDVPSTPFLGIAGTPQDIPVERITIMFSKESLIQRASLFHAHELHIASHVRTLSSRTTESWEASVKSRSISLGWPLTVAQVLPWPTAFRNL